MVGWHHRFSGHELGQTPGDGEGQGGLACCSPWDGKESHMPGQLNNSNRNRNVILNNQLFFILLLYIVSKTSLGVPCHVEI